MTLLDDTSVIGSGMVAGDGTWAIVTSALAAGPQDLTATETDFAGNVSGASAPLALTVKTIAPPPTNLALSPASDSGVLGGDITNVTAPTIIGSGELGDTVTLLNGTSMVGSGTTAADGTWMITTSPLTAGANVLTATETDIAGNTSTSSVALTIAVKAALPVTMARTLTVAGNSAELHPTIGIAAPTAAPIFPHPGLVDHGHRAAGGWDGAAVGRLGGPGGRDTDRCPIFRVGISAHAKSVRPKLRFVL